MSIPAVKWAINETRLTGTRKLVLITFAEHADKGSAHAYPGIPRIASALNCTDRTVRRHIADLVDQGYLSEGDQRLAAKIPADRRPIVYQLAMTEETRERWAAASGAAGVNRRRDAASAAGRKGVMAKAVRSASMPDCPSPTRTPSGMTGDTVRPDSSDSNDLTVLAPRPDTGVRQTTSGTTMVNHQTTDAGLSPSADATIGADDALLREAQVALGERQLDDLLDALGYRSGRDRITKPRSWLVACLKSKSTDKERCAFIRSLWWSDVCGHLTDQQDRDILEQVLADHADELYAVTPDGYRCEPASAAPVVWDHLRDLGAEFPGQYLTRIAADGIGGVWKIVRDALAEAA
ncbi:helix-turn-helix domain-containing protein [Nocardioides sp.]|uniref:helix-turn-helix domain-containing protein n=1 Tax=Nocardioides sp. TaxID=35761 RepID=UPI002630E45F|nr:helix-turn-helix domain-containing protein [Nocardioides sp.]MDI6910482.1 helix-turn-helix domain-containing protein [Nocardioides sp.]